MKFLKRKSIKLVIHIGSPKTGSSSIQAFLNYNRGRLFSDYKIIYPNFDEKSFELGVMHNHARFFLQAKDSEAHLRIVMEKFQQLLDYCRKNSLEQIVVSNEGWRFPWWIALMKDISARFSLKTRVIVYLRRQDKYLESAWKQWGHKLPGCENIFDYEKKLKLDWFAVLQHWKEAFGAGAITVVPYEKSAIGDNIIINFLHQLGIREMGKMTGPPPEFGFSNDGFNNDVIEIMKYSRVLLKSEHDNTLIDFMNQNLSEVFKKKPMEEYSLLSPKARLEIVGKYSESNRRIAAEYLGRSEGELFTEPLPAENEKWVGPEPLSIEKVIPVFLDIMVNQQKQLENLQTLIRKQNEKNT